MNGFQAVKDFIRVTSEPFMSAQVVKVTGLGYPTVKKYLQDLVANGTIMAIGSDIINRNIYITASVSAENVKKYICDLTSKGVICNQKLLKPQYRLCQRTQVPYMKNRAESKYRECERVESNEIHLIKSFVKKTTTPFTSTQVVEATNVFFETVKKTLRELVFKNILTATNGSNGEIIYEKPCLKVQPRKEPHSLQSIRNFINSSVRPFTAQQIMNEIGLSEVTVGNYLNGLKKEGVIRQIGLDNKIKVYAKVKHQAKQRHYTLEYIKEAYRRQMKKRSKNQ